MSEQIRFGPFTLIADERRLLRDGVPVDPGARAFDILAVLSARPNEIIGKADLLALVWPDVVVEEGSLRFQITRLRKMLDGGGKGSRYIATLPGRGYCFVAPVFRTGQRHGEPDQRATGSYAQTSLPGRLTRMVGREADTAALSALLIASRFVTIVGTGGVGKTTVALSIGHELIGTFDGEVHFADLGALSDPDLLATTMASILGLSPGSDDALAALIAGLTDRRILLILDTCEHVIDATASLAARIHATLPQVHMLATSREPLHVEGEHIYRLPPLACPPDDVKLTVASVQDFPASRLLMERATAGGACSDLDETDALAVGEICRKLDGVPLAIELAAARIAGFGLQETAALLNERLTLSWLGLRTAPPRQRTLQATLDWSYDLLSAAERLVLCRLAIFVGHFSIDAVLAVVTGPGIDEELVFGAIDSLVARSMIATRPVGAVMRYRLLDTTRAYALQFHAGNNDFADLPARHAAHYLRWLDETGDAWPTLSSAVQRSVHLAGLANVRAALEWCFGPGGNTATGIRLCVAAVPVFLSMSLLSECHRWMTRALDALDDTEREGPEEMHLQAALGISLMFTRGGQDAARTALDRSFTIAEARGTATDQIQILGPLQMFYLRTGHFRTALDYARRCSCLAGALEDSVSTTLAHSVMGISLHLNGESGRAQAALETALRYGPRSDRTTINSLGFDGRLLAGAILARTLWLRGYPDQATERALLTIEDAETLDHPLTLSIVLVWAVSLFLWTGDLDRAGRYIDRLFARARHHSLGPYLSVGRGFQGELSVRQGELNSGIRSLQQALTELHAAPYELLTTPLNIALAQGLAATRRIDEALALTDETMRSVEANGDLCYMPELLRVKGNIVLAAPRCDSHQADICFAQSFELSRQQGARAWELRTAIDVVALAADHDRSGRCHEILVPVFSQFTEGSATVDLISAARLLGT